MGTAHLTHCSVVATLYWLWKTYRTWQIYPNKRYYYPVDMLKNWVDQWFSGKVLSNIANMAGWIFHRPGVSQTRHPKGLDIELEGQQSTCGPAGEITWLLPTTHKMVKADQLFPQHRRKSLCSSWIQGWTICWRLLSSTVKINQEIE